VEIPLIKNDINYLIDYPFFSPDGKKLFVSDRGSGLQLISIDALSERYGKLSIGTPLNIKIIGVAMDWSADGKWIYTERTEKGKVEHYQIEFSSGRVRSLLTIPFTVEGKTYYMVDEKTKILVSTKNQSDVWVAENFDQKIK
jgi:Tol biopolymer transport system component